jgi:hypothetical protein
VEQVHFKQVQVLLLWKPVCFALLELIRQAQACQLTEIARSALLALSRLGLAVLA